MFKVIKLKYIIWVLVIVIVSVVVGVGISKVSATSPKTTYTVVIDAGHGGIDGGCVGATSGVTESTINLNVAKYLERMLSRYGMKVVMTRSTNDGLYSAVSKNKKLDDMQKRKEIIEKAKPDIVVSVHMNSFTDPSEHGAQTFYQEDSESGKKLATCVQDQLKRYITNARDFSNHTDLYILKCIDNPSIVVEGGFLSNPEDEKMLISNEHQEKLAYAIFTGILKYFACVNY